MRDNMFLFNSIEKAKQRGNLLKPMASQSIVDRIINRLINAIIDGELKPGQKIPTETELCASMQVGRNSVREAIKALVAMGVLNIRRAEGTFVAEGFSDRMLDPMVYGLILEGGNSSSLIELRRMFEVGVLQIAIEKARPEDIERIQKALSDLRAVIEKGCNTEELLDADMLFHSTLVQTVRNSLVEKIYMVIERLSRSTRMKVTESFIMNDDQQNMLNLHEEMLRLIIDKDNESVSMVIDEHFKHWEIEIESKDKSI